MLTAAAARSANDNKDQENKRATFQSGMFASLEFVAGLPFNSSRPLKNPFLRKRNGGVRGSLHELEPGKRRPRITTIAFPGTSLD